jgi:tRNA(Ile)-lysidine synthase
VDDQAETVLFRIMRGTGLRGLGGIPDRRGRIVRPLLPFGRSELEEHLRTRQIPFLRDPSNEDLRWARARVRHLALPALERSWRADAASRLAALARTASRADAALDDVAWRLLLSARRDVRPPAEVYGAGHASRWSFAAERLALQDDELLARGLRRLARRAGVRLRAGGTEAGVEFIKQGRSGAELDLGGGLRMWREFATIRVGFSAASLDDQLLAVTSMKSGSGSLLLGGRRYRAEWSVDENQGPGGGFVVVPDELLRFPLDLRARRPGDRIRLATGSRTLKRLFNDRRVPKGERGRLPVLASGNTVLWAYGLAVAEGLRAGPAKCRSESALTVRIVPTGDASGSRTGTCNEASG